MASCPKQKISSSLSELLMLSSKKLLLLKTELSSAPDWDVQVERKGWKINRIKNLLPATRKGWHFPTRQELFLRGTSEHTSVISSNWELKRGMVMSSTHWHKIREISFFLNTASANSLWSNLSTSTEAATHKPVIYMTMMSELTESQNMLVEKLKQREEG